MSKIDVFISRKSQDASYAKKIYDYLTAQGLVVFESDNTLKELGNADYIKAIDESLVKATHMIVVGSSIENINSPWVESEWLFFLNRKRSGKTSGNLFTVVAKDLKLDDLPPSLANYEVIPYNKKNFPVIYNYAREPNSPAKKAPKVPFPAEELNKRLWISIAVLLVGVLSFCIYFSTQPYDATVFLKPKEDIKLQSAYPSFKGGELSVFIDNKEEKKQILDNGEVVFKQLASSSKGDKVAFKLKSDYWKLEADSFQLSKTLNLMIVPDGSLAKVTGSIKNPNGISIGNVTIKVDNDTIFSSSTDGSFNINLPYHFQKEFYVLQFSKEGLNPIKEIYYPKSGNIDVLMRRDAI